jgi:hypothetical protein
MANEEHLVRLRQGVKVWNTWRVDCQEKRLDLRGMDFPGADLRNINLDAAILDGSNLDRADLSGASLRDAILRDATITTANLRKTDLRDAILSEANLTQANLRGAILSRADLIRTTLWETDLCEANLQGAELNGANLGWANLTGANLGEADLGSAQIVGTTLANINLTTTQGLDRCIHYGPSFVDIRTLQYGPLPQEFLRGCGLLDELIKSLPLLPYKPLQFHSCFISYSNSDQAFAKRLHTDLQDKGVRCWFAPHDIQGGKKINEQLKRAIREQDKLLLVLSKDSIKSEWVEFEIREGIRCEVREKRRVLFPIRLVDYDALLHWECFDADTKKDLAAEVRAYHIPDFSHWNDPDAYLQALLRLLRDLEAEAEKALSKITKG